MRPPDHDDDAAGEAEHDVHVVLDEKHGDVLRQAGDGREQLGALLARHAGGRLVEQQHLRLRRQRQRDLEQPLLAVGQLARQAVAVGRQRQRLQDGVGLLHRVGVGRERLPPVARHPVPLADGERHGLERVEVREQGVDLERAHQAALDAGVGLERR